MTVVADTVLVWFSCHRDYFRCRLPELSSLASLCGVNPDTLWVDGDGHEVGTIPGDTAHCVDADSGLQNCIDRGSEAAITLGQDDDVFLLVRLPLEDRSVIAESIIRRSVLIKGIFEVWAMGSSYSEVIKGLNPSSAGIKKHITSSKTFSFLVKAFGHHLSQTEQISRMAKFSFLFTNDIKADLRNPDTQLAIFEKWMRKDVKAEPQLQAVYFGRAISLRPKGVPWWWPYRLTVRPVLGPTTMDNELAFVMANQAQIKKNMVVLDPFCGTGGLLIAASHFGAFAVGADIDVRVLKGWGVSHCNKNLPLTDSKDTSIFCNFKEYNLPVPEIIRIDTGAWTRDSSAEATRKRTSKPWVDAILTDPPYGIRASVRKVTKKGPVDNKEEHKMRSSSYIPATSTISSSAVIEDLLNLAATFLVDGGLLVFLLPVSLSSPRSDVAAAVHPDLKLQAASLQSLSAGVGRVLMTMRRLPRRKTPSGNVTNDRGFDHPVAAADTS